MSRQDDAELVEHLRETTEFMVRSCQAYDEGYEGEARRLAVSVRVLLHDTQASTSLLVQLRRKAGLRLWATGPDIHPENFAPDAPLLVMRVEAKDGTARAEWIPRCVAPQEGAPPHEARLVQFSRWWDTIVLKSVAGVEAQATAEPDPDDPSKTSVSLAFNVKVEGGKVVRGDESFFTRRQIVLALANKDGGAHVDPILNDAYYRLSRTEGLGWKVVDAMGERTMEHTPELATMRQIAHEVLMTLHGEFPDVENEYLPPYMGSTTS